MKKQITFIAFILIFAGLSAQWDKIKKQTISKSDSAFCSVKSGDSAKFRNLFQYNISYPFFVNDKETKPLTDSLNYFVRMVAGNLDDSLNQYALNWSLKKELDSLYQNWEKDLKVGFCYNFMNTESIDLVYNNKYYCTLINEYYAYDGGAHGVAGEDYIVVDKKTGKNIKKWQQLFNDTTAVLNAAKAEFRKLKQIQDETYGTWFWGNEFYLTQNFGILPDGLVFYYQSYEIAPYAAGPTELFLSWKALKAGKFRKKGV